MIQRENRSGARGATRPTSQVLGFRAVRWCAPARVSLEVLGAVGPAAGAAARGDGLVGARGAPVGGGFYG